MTAPLLEAPPEVEAFRAWREPAGARAARLDVSGVAVEFQCLPDELADHMTRAYGPYLSAPTGKGRPLTVRVLRAPVEYFIPPGFVTALQVYRMLTAHEEGIFRTVSYRLASWVDVAGRTGEIALGSGDLDPAPRALENFLRSSVAWMALDRGGFFLHGASVVRGGRCFLFYGPSGAGKSTLAAGNTEGEVISDDLTLVLKEGDRLVAAGGPFRGTYTRGAPLVGTFPVAGFYRLRKDDRTWVAPDDGGCFADLLGNLPFVVDQFPRHDHLIDRIRAVVAGARLRYLHFRKDASVWPAIDAEAAGRTTPGASGAS
jgi:hypothetical protein